METSVSAVGSSAEAVQGSHRGPRKYWEEWMDLFEGEHLGNKLKYMALSIKLADCRFRSICWKVFLECLPETRQDWIYVTRERRSKYTSLLNQVAYNPRQGTKEIDLDLNNPLSQDLSSPWNQYFEDSELKVTITQDVIRTFPEIEFFQTADVQQMMVNILFCYARQHQQVSYRQGMHELLAPIIFVLHHDQQTFLHALELGYVNEFPSPIRDDIRELLNPDFTEHDAFFLFSQVMDGVESWYICNESATRIDQFGFTPFSKASCVGMHNVLGVKLCKINEQMLKRYDYVLYNHLESMEIPLHIFGIRWLRLLFGREFGLPDLLIIWDAIFAESLAFCLVDFIFIAMLICIRDKLLNADYTQCLSCLMKYPGGSYITYIIQMALHLKHPMQYTKPSGEHLVQQNRVSTGAVRELQRTSNARTETMDNAKSSRRPKTLPLPGHMAQAFKANSEPTTLDSSPEASDGDDENSLRGDQRHGVRKAGYNTWTLRSLKGPNAITRSLNQLVNSSEDDRVREMVTLKAKNLASSSAAGIAESQTRRHKMIRQQQIGCKPGKQVVHSTTAEKCTVKDTARLHHVIKDCYREMNVHLSLLQECLCSQELQREDEMLLALASLKRVRDNLKEATDSSDMEEEIATDAEQMDDWTLITASQPVEGNRACEDMVLTVREHSLLSVPEQDSLQGVPHPQEAKKKKLVALVSSQKEQTSGRISDGGGGDVR
ncbi:TBC1 domain family member 5-like isoform X2 [Ornithodoros turicata]|uniref:TBC1 domain family member 5-like isoform X2 n=1 Tax=Ornithodoros turicata TaxID=34597 RepID=UPI003139C23C